MTTKRQMEKERADLLARRAALPIVLRDEDGAVDGPREEERAAEYTALSDRIAELDRRLDGGDDADEDA